MKDNSGLVKFITRFLNEAKSYGISDYVTKSEWYMRLENIEDFTEIKNL